MFELRFGDPDYPQTLRSIDKPPKILWGEGDLALLGQTMIAIVGSREPTDYGKAVAYDFSRSLAQKGVVVVSGLAYGIDTMTHEGALATGGKTIAVLGCGLDVPYPKENLDLKRRITQSGVVLTEFPLATAPASWTFPQRNRIISGLAAAVVVVEATRRSGALVTAKWALAQGREVFAVPGNINVPQSEGPNRLIQEGATPVLSVEDIFGALRLPFAVSSQSRYNEPRDKKEQLKEILSQGARSIDEIVEATQLGAGEVSSLLVTLEIEGMVEALPGGRFKNV